MKKKSVKRPAAKKTNPLILRVTCTPVEMTGPLKIGFLAPDGTFTEFKPTRKKKPSRTRAR